MPWRGFSEHPASVAFRTEPEKFELVRHRFEPVGGTDSLLDFCGETFSNLHHLGAPGANEMMMLPILPFTHEFDPRGTIAEMEPLDHARLLQQVHGAVDGGEVALARRQSVEDFPDGERMRMLAEHL